MIKSFKFLKKMNETAVIVYCVIFLNFHSSSLLTNEDKPI